MNDTSEHWKVEYDENAGVVVATIWGHPEASMLMSFSGARTRLAEEKGTLHTILDTSGILPEDFSSYKHVYETVAATYPEIFTDPGTKIAVIPPNAQEAHWFVEFYLKVCASHGWLAREVASREEAIAWFEEAPADPEPVPQPSDRQDDAESGKWSVRFLDELGIVDLTYRGAIDGDIVLAASAARIDMGKRKNTSLFLIDTEQVTVADGTAEAIFERVTKTYHYENADPDSRIGVVKPARADAGWFVQFFEQLGQSRGWNVRRFDSREAAIDWILA